MSALYLPPRFPETDALAPTAEEIQENERLFSVK